MSVPYPYTGGQVPPAPGPHAYQVARPGTLTGAAVIAFVAAGLGVIGGFLAILGGSMIGALGAGGTGGLFVVLGLVTLALAGVYIWGGVVALSGKNTKILLLTAGASALLNLFTFFSSAGGLIGIAVAGVIIGLLMAPASRGWVRMRGGETF